METKGIEKPFFTSLLALYSLEKLIEWKLKSFPRLGNVLFRALYSLEKLIEWKPEYLGVHCQCCTY